MIAIVLGSGLNSLAELLEVENTIVYQSILDFKIYPLEGHDHKIYEAQLNGNKIIILSGKLHMYEGYDYRQSTSLLQYVHENYTIEQWLITSASGALSKHIKVGKWQQVSDIITLENIKGLHFSILNRTHTKTMGATYAYQKGPSLGTVSEYKILSKFGGDLVGMSMLPEQIFLDSINANYKLYSIPVCTYHPITYYVQEPKHTEVMAIAEAAVPELVRIVSSLKPSL